MRLRLNPRGADELDDLGRTLDALAAKRQADDGYAARQTELKKRCRSPTARRRRTWFCARTSSGRLATAPSSS